MKQNRILLCVVLFLMIFNILVPVLYAQQPLSGMSEEERNKKIKDAIQKHREEKEKTRHPKLEPILTDLEDEYDKGAEEAAKKFNAGEVLKDDNGAVITSLEDAKKKGGEDAAKKFAKRRGIEIKDGNKIPVRLTLENGITAETFDKKILESYGGVDIGGWGRYLGADIPIDKIRKIADEVEEIIWIEKPTSAVPESFRSEGLSKIGFQNYSVAGIRGSGVKIAVIDTGFYGLSSATSNGDLPNSITKIDCTSRSLGCKSDTFSSEGTEHGTAVAEIIYDMAKDAQFYLLKVSGNDQETLKNAVAYCRDPNNGIKIINHSAGWFNTNFNDGECWKDYGFYNPVCSVNDAYGTGGSSNILFVKSAGNYGKRHYSANYDDTGTDGWHKTIPSFYAYGGTTVSLYLTWDAWATTNQDYDIYIFDDFLGIPAGCSGETRQTGSQSPTEKISCTVDLDGYYYLYIVKQSATSNHKFKVYSYSHDLDPYVSAGSISSPADAEHAMAVGAINHANWTTGPQESYSSQGPTTDNRKKPEIMGPDGVSTYSYGQWVSGYGCEPSNYNSLYSGFCGTSAAAPHVAGAAALMLSQNQNYTVSQLWSALTSSAVPMSGTDSNCQGDPNNCFGNGRLSMPALYTLSTSKTGNGTVTSSPSGISCGSDCSGSYISGISVALTATPDTGYLFEGWSGACSGQTCQITMSGNKNATANFYMPTLSVLPTGAGNGTITSSPAGINCGATCSANFNAGSPVTLSVTPETGSSFLGWSGAGCSGAGQCNVTMSDSTSVTASFGVDTATCPNGPAKIVGKSSYQTLQAAYNAAVDGDTIQTQAITITENVTADRNISISINGGYNCYYTSNPMTTALKGALTISSGTVNIKDFNLQN